MERRSIWSLISEEEREALQAEVRSSWQQRLARFPERTLLWLALMPFCTIALAEACSFPLNEGFETMQALFASLLKDDLCDVKQASPNLITEDQKVRLLPEPDGRHDYYTLAETVRSYLLQRVQFDTADGMPELLRELQALGQALLDAPQKGEPVPPSLARWADLASAASSTASVSKRFGEKIDELLTANQLNEALRWIEAARRLADMLKGELMPAVDQASRRMELQHRRSYDEQNLTHFLVRNEQIAAFNHLLDQKSSTAWALHFVAPGGFGKTMLMRYITTRLIAERGGSVARVDFDYLNPGYPSRAPALLLDQFAQELRLQGNEQSEKEFGQFSRKMSTFYERFTSGLIGGATMAQMLEDAEFLNLLRTFAAALSSLPQPVVLILDTCEELAKIRPDGVIPENVRATFQILEQLHRMLPALRVIFSGRRPLASSGAGGWSCPSSTHPRRSYLLLHEIRGFTQQEAMSYLRDLMQVREELIEPIQEKSPDTDKGGLFSYGRTKPQVDSLEPRYNPFDLWLYASWANADSTLTAEALRAADMDSYIEQRIVGHIDHPDLRSLLPAVSLLGTFDRETLREVSSVSDEAFNTVFQELQNQEWIQLQQFTFWKVKSGLRERLRGYYCKHNPAALRKVRRSIIPYLERITQEWPLERLNISHFDVALRLLEESDPLRAAAWWEKIEDRFANEPNAYGWVLDLIEWLKGEEGAIAEGDEAEGRPESVLRAAVLTTYAVAQLHTTPALTAERRATWLEVVNKLERHPTEAGRARLLMRARAALTTLAEDKDIEELSELFAAAFQHSPDEQSIAALIAALESLIEAYEPIPPQISFQERNEEIAGPARREPLDWQRLLRFVDLLHIAQLSPELHTFALSLAARACKLAGDWPGMERYFAQALARLAQLRPYLQCWLDWRAPANLPARVQLEYIRACYPSLHSPQYVLEQVGNVDVVAQNRRPDIDLDRLQTALLQLQAAQSPPQIFGEQTAFPYVKFEEARSGLNWEPACNAHRTFQPFFSASAEEEARQGNVNLALAELQVMLDGASPTTMPRVAGSTTLNQDAARSVDRAVLRIKCRARWQEGGIGSVLIFSGYDEQWALDGLNGSQKNPGELADFSRRISSRLSTDAARESEYAALLCHARWRTSYMLHLEWALGALSSQLAAIEMRVRTQGEPERASFAALSLALDALEINAVCQRIGIPPFLPTLSATQLQSIREKWFAPHRDQPVEALTLALRAAALDPGRSQPPHFPDELIQRIGVRRAAQIALDEGEMLALRLPEYAMALLDQALIWFTASHDPMSQFITAITLALVHARLGNRQQLIQLLHSHFGQRYFEYIPDVMRLVPNIGQNSVRGEVLHPSRLETVTVRDLLENKLFDRMLAAMPEEQRSAVRYEILLLPWLVRWLACATWSVGPGAEMQELERWLVDNYSVTPEAGEGEKFLPADLDGWPAWPGAQPSLIRPPQPDQPSLPQLDQPPAPHSEDREIVLSFTSRDDPGNIRRGGLSVTMSMVAPPGSSLADPHIGSYATPPTLVPAFISYEQSAGRSSDLKYIAQLLPLTRPLTLELLVDEATSALCWEGLVTLALAEVSQQSAHQIDLQQLQMYRAMAKLPVWPTPTPGGIIELAIVSKSYDATMLQRRVWQELNRDTERALVEYNYGLDEIFSARQRVLNIRKMDVLHVVAPVIETGKGELGFELEADASSVGSSEGRLWHADYLFNIFRELMFCIIQAPAASTTRRSTTDREIAATQRRFAAQLFTQGVPIVLTIPTLPSVAGEQVVRCFVETLSNSEVPSLAALLTALARARTIILELASPWSREDALEVAMDMCLYYAREGNANQ